VKNRTRPGFGSQLESCLGEEEQKTEREPSVSGSSVVEDEEAQGSHISPAEPEDLEEPEKRNSSNLNYLHVVGVADLDETSGKLGRAAPGRRTVSAQGQKRHSSPYLQTQKIVYNKGKEKRAATKHNAFL